MTRVPEVLFEWCLCARPRVSRRQLPGGAGLVVADIGTAPGREVPRACQYGSKIQFPDYALG